MTDFYTQVLGLRLSDRIPGKVTFLNAGPGDHHIFGFITSSHRGFHHASFEVPSIDAIALGADRMRAKGREAGWGLGRHHRLELLPLQPRPLGFLDRMVLRHRPGRRPLGRATGTCPRTCGARHHRDVPEQPRAQRLSSARQERLDDGEEVGRPLDHRPVPTAGEDVQPRVGEQVHGCADEFRQGTTRSSRPCTSRTGADRRQLGAGQRQVVQPSLPRLGKHRLPGSRTGGLRLAR